MLPPRAVPPPVVPRLRPTTPTAPRPRIAVDAKGIADDDEAWAWGDPGSARGGGLAGAAGEHLGGEPTVPLPRQRAAAGRLRLRDRFGRARWRGVRLDPGRPGATALVLVAAVAAVVAAVGVWTARPQAEAVRGLPGVVVGGTAEAAGGAGGTERTRGTAGGGVAGDGAGPGGGAADGAAGAAAGSAGAGSENAPGGVLVVSVSGRVAHPGVVRVPVGSRVADALTAAGGPQPGTDLTGLNLARRVVDGEQIAVGVPPAPDAAGQPPAGSAAGAGPAGTGGGPAAPAGKVDLNTATLAQLDALPGVGPVTAQHIVEWRTRNGRFARVDQLREIDGIGERRYQQLRGLVMV